MISTHFWLVPSSVSKAKLFPGATGVFSFAGAAPVSSDPSMAELLLGNGARHPGQHREAEERVCLVNKKNKKHVAWKPWENWNEGRNSEQMWIHHHVVIVGRRGIIEKIKNKSYSPLKTIDADLYLCKIRSSLVLGKKTNQLPIFVTKCSTFSLVYQQKNPSKENENHIEVIRVPGLMQLFQPFRHNGF